jgi:hypothetical protein
VTLSNGSHLRADYIFSCVGAARNSDVVAASPALKPALMPRGGKVCTDEYLRVPLACPTSTGTSSTTAAAGPNNGAASFSVFALGDVAAHASAEPDVAHTAEKHAIAISRSIIAIAAARRRAMCGDSSGGSGRGRDDARVLCAYPAGIAHGPTSPVIFAVSLGPYHGLLSFDSVAITDPWLGQRLAAFGKFAIERSKTWQLGDVAPSVWFWRVADEAAVAVHQVLAFVAPSWAAAPA